MARGCRLKVATRSRKLALPMAEVVRGSEPEGVRAIAALQQSSAGGSGSFLIRGDDGGRYWCKALNNPQHPRVPINEQVVARLGELIGAAVCSPALVYISEDLARSGWEFRPGVQLERGWVHGSRAVDGVIETYSLDHRGDDDNAVRHASFYALHDWLAGSDPQWLIAGGEQNRYYSHDHGHYFAPTGPAWTADALRQHVADTFTLPFDPAGLDDSELQRLAAALDALSRQDIAVSLAKLPTDWPIEDHELDALLEFVDLRRSPVAQRLRGLLPQQP